MNDPTPPRRPELFRLHADGGRSAHDHRVRRFSADYSLLRTLRGVATDERGAAAAIGRVCRAHAVPVPDVTFHGRRGPHTGYCQAPAAWAEAALGTPALRAWEERTGRPWPPDGMIRLGRRPALATVAHEAAHHLVHHHEAPGVATHGRAWVAWYDAAAAALAGWCAVQRMDPNPR